MSLRLPPLERLRFLESRRPILQIESWSNATRTILIRGFTQHGLFSFDHTTNADRSRAVDSFRLPDFPISVQASPSTSPVRRGECYIRLTLMLGGFPIMRLAAGYITDSKTITWPPGVYESFTSGSGLLRTVVGSDPAAGNEVTITVPTNTRWRLLFLRIQFTTSATVATRDLSVTVDDGSNAFLNIRAGATQAESLTRNYYFVAGYPERETAFDALGSIRVPLPPDLILFQGYRVRTVTQNLQVDDDFAAPIFYVEEWVEE